MPKLLLYYAHPGQQFSHCNAALWAQARSIPDITLVDLYAEYPRFDVDPDREQQRLRDHDIILFQFPLFWYAPPSLVKEWCDIVLEHGFAYGSGGDKLAGKRMGLAITAAGPQDAYRSEGYQHHNLRSFLTPLEQTANLCQMRWLPPYVLFGALNAASDGRLAPHVSGYARLIEALKGGTLDAHETGTDEVWTAATLPLKQEA